jgi:hypothetical protein
MHQIRSCGKFCIQLLLLLKDIWIWTKNNEQIDHYAVDKFGYVINKSLYIAFIEVIIVMYVKGLKKFTQVSSNEI